MKNDNLVWIDLEMTGLDIAIDQIVQIATIITDTDLNIVAVGPDIVISQPDSVIESLDEWCIKHFTENGLIERIKTSKISLEEAEIQTLDFIKQYCDPETSPLCGNSVYNDRIFIRTYMPDLDRHLHYRLIDVSTVKELYKRWMPGAPAFEKKDLHNALEDIKESVEELKFYRKNFFTIKTETE